MKKLKDFHQAMTLSFVQLVDLMLEISRIMTCLRNMKN